LVHFVGGLDDFLGIDEERVHHDIQEHVLLDVSKLLQASPTNHNIEHGEVGAEDDCEEDVEHVLGDEE